MIGANGTVTLVVGHSEVTDGRRLLLLQTQYCSLLLPVKPALLREGRALQPLSDDLCLPCLPTGILSHKLRLRVLPKMASLIAENKQTAAFSKLPKNIKLLRESIAKGPYGAKN